MVSHKKQYYTGIRKIRGDAPKYSKSYNTNESTITSSEVDDSSMNESSMNDLFENKTSTQMMGNSMNQMNPMMNQMNPMMNQMNPMMNQMNPMMDPMMDPTMNQMNPMMMGNSHGGPNDHAVDPLSIQTFAPLNRQHNGGINGISNLALLNNNRQEPIYTESDAQPNVNPQWMNHPGMNHAGMNHPGMNHAGMNQPEINHAGMSQPGINHAGMSQPGMNYDETEINNTDIAPPKSLGNLANLAKL